jgi:hypothetical protein
MYLSPPLLQGLVPWLAIYPKAKSKLFEVLVSFIDSEKYVVSWIAPYFLLVAALLTTVVMLIVKGVYLVVLRQTVVGTVRKHLFLHVDCSIPTQNCALFQPPAF